MIPAPESADYETQWRAWAVGVAVELITRSELYRSCSVEVVFASVLELVAPHEHEDPEA